MQNRNIVIFGASGGIGSKCAEYLDGLGANLYLVAKNEDKLKRLQSKLNGNSQTIIADVRNSKDIKAVFSLFEQDKIRISGLVYSVGIEAVRPLRVMNREYITDIMNVNCLAFAEICKYMCNKRFSEDGASIVAISSLASLQNYTGELAYCVSKSALDSVVRSAAHEMVNRRIRVNSIQPGATETAMIDKVRERIVDYDENVFSVQPYGIIDPKAIAYLVEFLLSDKAKYISGACIPNSAGRKI